MAPVINRNNYSSQRSAYLRFISSALIELENKNAADVAYKDIWTFIYLTMVEIQKSIQKTIQPWEKRDYWVKVEKFRADWVWLDLVLNSIKKKFNIQDWKALESDGKTLKDICQDYPPYQRMTIKEPWIGAWKKWKEMKKASGS